MKQLSTKQLVTNFLVFVGLLNFVVSFSFATYVLFLIEKGVGLWGVGIINACFMFTTVACEVPTGVIADSIGRRRSILISSLVMCLGFIVYFISGSFILFILAEVLLGIGLSFASGALDAWLVDGLQDRNQLLIKDEVFIQKSKSRTIGTVLGCLSGSALGAIDLSLPWLASAILSVFLGLFAYINIREADFAIKSLELNRFSQFNKKIREAILKAIMNKQLMPLMVFGAILSISFQALNMQWTVLFKNDYHFTSFGLGLLFAAISIISALGSHYSKNLRRLINNEVLALFLSQLVTALAIIVCSQSFGQNLVIGSFLIHEFGRGFIDPIKNNFVNNIVQSKERATMLSVDSMFSKSGAFIGLIASGFISNVLPIRIMWLLSGILLAAGTLIFIFFQKRKIETNGV